MSAVLQLVSDQPLITSKYEDLTCDHALISKDFILSLHTEAVSRAKIYRRSELELLKILILVEDYKIYHQFGLTSLFSYCVDLLNLSRHVAYDFIQVMRTSKEIPGLLQAIELDQITVSKARKICSVITAENAKEWIDLVIHCSSRVVEKAVAIQNPRSQVREKLAYISEGTLELRLAVSEEWADLLQKTKDRLSQKYQRSIGTEEALLTLMKDSFEKHDPVAKARRARKKCMQKTEKRATTVRSRAIPAPIKHAVYLRDRGQCTHSSALGQRCESKRWIDIHHIQSFAEGGSHDLDNLETLCRAHHQMKHREQELVT